MIKYTTVLFTAKLPLLATHFKREYETADLIDSAPYIDDSGDSL